MNRFTGRERLLLTLLAGLLLLALIYFKLTPRVIEYRELCQEIEQTIKKSNQLVNINEELATEQNKLLITKYQLQKLRSNLNMELRAGSLYVRLDEGAQANNVVIKEIVPQKVTNNGIFLKLPIDISISGDYRNILAYMQWLENVNDWANLSEITQFIIEPADEFSENCNGVVNSTLTLALYSNITPESCMQSKELLNRPTGRSNGFIPITEYHYLHNNRQNGGQ